MIRLSLLVPITYACLFLGTPALGQGVDWSSAPVHTSLESARAARAAGEPIYRLDLSKKRLKTFPEEIASWTEIREVVLDRNKLKRIGADLSQWAFIERFSAVSNDLESFPSSAVQWTSLQTLELGDNTIDSIPLDIDQLTNLRVLSLWSNVIAYYPASLGDLRQLQSLDLQYNDMTLEEQELLKSWLPTTVNLNLSAPCRCDFDE